MRSVRQWAVLSACHMQPWSKTNKQHSIGNKSIHFHLSFTLNDSFFYHIRSSFSTESPDSLPVEKDLTSHFLQFGSCWWAVLVVNVGRMVILIGHFVVLKSGWAGQRANTGCRSSFCGVVCAACLCVGFGTLLKSAAVEELDPQLNTRPSDAVSLLVLWANRLSIHTHTDRQSTPSPQIKVKSAYSNIC